MQDKDSIRSSINKRMNVVHRCIRTPNIVLRALSYSVLYGFLKQRANRIQGRDLGAQRFGCHAKPLNSLTSY